jgi:ABC-2 type transport system permease protein
VSGLFGLALAEIRRLFSRRAFRFMGAAVIAGILIAAVITFVRSSNDPSSGVEQARREVAQCEAARQDALERSAPESEGWICPTEEEIRGAYDKRFVYARSMPDATRAVGMALFMLAFIVGASFVGAEFGSGTITTLLTWEPRRGLVLAAKVVACVVVVSVAAVLALAFLDLVLLPVAAIRGSTEGVGGLWDGLAVTWARAAGLTAFGSALAMGIAFFTRNTAATLAIGFGYNAIVDPLLSVLWEGRFRTWLFAHNLPRMMGFPVEASAREPDIGGGLQQTVMTTSIGRPALLFTIYAVAVLAIAYAAFRARDVT